MKKENIKKTYNVCKCKNPNASKEYTVCFDCKKQFSEILRSIVTTNR
jgi:hypothetical protein